MAGMEHITENGSTGRQRKPSVVALWIPGPLPGLNELLGAAKGSGGHGIGYAKLKRQWTDAIWALSKAARLPRFMGPVHLRFEWIEKDRRRDPDNVAAAKKLVCDGLVKAGVLEGDGWRHIDGWSDRWAVDAKRPGVEVAIISSVSGDDEEAST